MRFLLISFLCVLSVQNICATSTSIQGQERWGGLCEDQILAHHNPSDALLDWLGGLSDEGVQALTELLQKKAFFIKTDTVRTSATLGLDNDDLVNAQSMCGTLSLPYLFLHDIKQKNFEFLKDVLPIMQRFDADWPVVEAVLRRTHERTHQAEQTALLDALKGLPRDRLQHFAQELLPTYQLQMIIYAQPPINLCHLPLLRYFLKDVRDSLGEDNYPRGQLESRSVLSAFLSTSVPVLATVANTNIMPEVRLAFLDGAKALSLRQARLVAKLLEADPGRDVWNLLHKMEESSPRDADLDALEALTQDVRRYHFVVSGAPLSPDMLSAVKELFAGCDTVEEKEIESALRTYVPSTDLVRAVNAYALTPLQRAAMLREVNDLSLLSRIKQTCDEETRARVVTLFRNLTSGCDAAQTSAIARPFHASTQPAREAFIALGEALALCDFDPFVREKILSRKLRPDTFVSLKALLERLEPSLKEDFFCAPDLHQISASFFEKVHEAQFEKHLIPDVVCAAWWLEERGWRDLAHFTALKWGLEGANTPYATLNLSALRESNLTAPQWMRLRSLEPHPDLLNKILQRGKPIFQSRQLEAFCEEMRSKTHAQQSEIFERWFLNAAYAQHKRPLVPISSSR